MNGGHTTYYVNLERGNRREDPISAYLFILLLEILFITIISNKNIHDIKILKDEYLYTAYADDTKNFTMFCKNCF